MPVRQAALVLTLSAALAGCVGEESVMRNAPLPESLAMAPPTRLVEPSFRVEVLDVQVPRALSVSESNRFNPMADIVWRGDKAGDRHAQVAALVYAGMGAGAATLEGIRSVAVDVRIDRFHSVTERARYTVGGTHAITFTMTVRDPRSGNEIVAPRTVTTELKALGGAEAAAAERAGKTQKKRIATHLAEVIRQELTRPYVETIDAVPTA